MGFSLSNNFFKDQSELKGMILITLQIQQFITQQEVPADYRIVDPLSERQVHITQLKRSVYTLLLHIIPAELIVGPAEFLLDILQVEGYRLLYMLDR